MNFSIKFLAVLVFIASIAGNALAQQSGSPSISAQTSNVSEFEVNGLKVILKRRASAPTISANLFIKGGARNLTPKTAGIENLMLNSAVEAGQTFSRQAVRREIARTGSTLGSSVGSDFSVVTLGSTREAFDQMWKVFVDVTMKPLFDPADVNRVRDQLVTALREQETVPDSALEAVEERIIFAGHPYSNDPTGTIESLTPITPAQLREYHKRSMETSRLLLVFVGDVD